MDSAESAKTPQNKVGRYNMQNDIAESEKEAKTKENVLK